MFDMLGEEIKVGDFLGLVTGRGNLSIRKVLETKSEKVRVYGPSLGSISRATKPAWVHGINRSRYNTNKYINSFCHQSLVILDKNKIEKLLETTK